MFYIIKINSIRKVASSEEFLKLEPGLYFLKLGENKYYDNTLISYEFCDILIFKNIDGNCSISVYK